jgi:hypothetical protein
MLLRTRNFLGFGLALAMAWPASATIVVTGGGAGANAAGAVRGMAFDPTGSGEDLDVDESYDDSDTGSLDGSSSGSASGFLGHTIGESTYLGSNAFADFTSDLVSGAGGVLESGGFDFFAGHFVTVDGEIFDEDGEFAMARARANVIIFVDLEILDTDYLLEAAGSVLDETSGLTGSVAAFVSLADVTSGFSFVWLHTDATALDGDATVFSSSALLEAGRKYRLGVLAATDGACAETPEDLGLCTPFDPEIPDSIPVYGPGGYFESAAAAMQFTITAVPEPGAGLLLGAGLTGLGLVRRARR